MPTKILAADLDERQTNCKLPQTRQLIRVNRGRLENYQIAVAASIHREANQTHQVWRLLRLVENALLLD